MKMRIYEINIPLPLPMEIDLETDYIVINRNDKQLLSLYRLRNVCW